MKRKKVLVFFPTEFKSTYKGGILNIINAYYENSSEFEKEGVEVSFFEGDKDQDFPSSIIDKIKYHVQYER